MGFQVFVCFTEMLIPKEAIVGREGRGMCRTEYQMLVTVNEGTFLLCITSPKDEYQIFSFFGQDTDGSICKLFPTATLVWTGLVGAYCQGGVQQQDALFSPSCQVTGGRGWRADIFFYFFENVHQRRRKGYSVIHRETKAVCLTGTMVGVLTDNDYFYFIKRT